MVPQSWIFMFFGLIVLVPNYPLVVSLIFLLSAIPPIIAFGKEANDLFYTSCLPIRKKDVVKSKIGFIVSYQLVYLLITAIALIASFFIYSQDIIGADGNVALPKGNSTGMDANIAIIGVFLLTFGIFNILFFPWYYSHPDKFTLPFFVSMLIASLLAVVLGCALPFFPVVGELFDAVTSSNWQIQLAFTLGSAVIFAVLTYFTYKLSVKNFIKIDI